MDVEALAKRIEFLEKEYRKDRAAINDLQDKLVSYEGNFNFVREQVKELSADFSKLSATSARLDQFDNLVTQYRNEANKTIEAIEKRREKHERDVDARRRLEIDNLNKAMLDLRKTVDGMDEFRKNLQARVDEDARLAREIGELEMRMEEYMRAADDMKRTNRAVDEARKQDAKRLADLSGELAAIRKRAEEARDKAELNGDAIRLLDGRMNELMSSEAERRQSQLSFIESQNLAQVERDRGWKEWQNRFETFSRQTSNLDAQLMQLEETQRAVKRSQETFEDINQRLERRIKEITEIQRLAEDRFRQEWVTFKADDQKRWTNYSLTQDELQKDTTSELEKINQRISSLDDLTQTLQDMLEQTTETTETQLQELMNWAHEWLTNYERIMGRSRPSR